MCTDEHDISMRRALSKPWLPLKTFFTREDVVAICNPQIKPSKYYYHVKAAALYSTVNVQDFIKSRSICLIGKSELTYSQPVISHKWKVLFYRYFRGHYSQELANLIPPQLSIVLLVSV